jgi:hypothetical protein
MCPAPAVQGRTFESDIHASIFRMKRPTDAKTERQQAGVGTAAQGNAGRTRQCDAMDIALQWNNLAR